MKIISEEVNRYFTELENNKKACLIGVILKIDDEGHTVYLEGFFESMKNSILFTPVIVKKEDLEDEENLTNKFIEEDEEQDPSTYFKKRYSKMIDYIIEIIRIETKKENQEYDLNNVRKENFGFFNIDAEDEKNVTTLIEGMRGVALEEMNNKNFELTGFLKDSFKGKFSLPSSFFANENMVRLNLGLITKFDNSIQESEVSFKLDGSKLLKGILLTLPYCYKENDTLYFIYTFHGFNDDSEYYVCQKMPKGMYVLRRNGEEIINMFIIKPSIDDVWQIITEQHETDKRENIIYSALYDEFYGLHYTSFDIDDTYKIEEWFGYTVYKTKIKYEGSYYWVNYNLENEGFIIFRDDKGRASHLIEEDLEIIPKFLEYLQENIDEIRKLDSILIYKSEKEAGELFTA
ncbi:MAG: hypothetical protein ACOX1L_06485 [Erysipelotrichaceae bacterium]|jgi:hypothetical protein